VKKTINIQGKIYWDLTNENLNVYKFIRNVDDPITDEELGKDSKENDDLDELRDILS
jgi:hypothetical protein